MARDRLQIFQGAFTALVGGRLLALDDPNAEPIALVYDSIVDDALMHEVWPWSLARVPLTDRDPAPDHAEAYRFEMPGFIPGQPDQTLERLSPGPLAVYDAVDVDQVTSQRWHVEGKYIYSDAMALWATFQFHTAETTWPVQFAEYIRLRICAEVVGVYKPDDGANLSVIYERRAEQKLAQVIDSTQQVEGPKVIFGHFQTTAGRTGDYLRPVTLNQQGRAAG